MRAFSLIGTVVVILSVALSLAAVAQDEPRITIEDVKSSGIKKKDYFYDVTGTVTISKAARKAKDLVVLVYTKSGEGGKVQLQTTGKPEDRDQEPRVEEIKDLKFDGNTASWKMRVWFGDANDKDPGYQVFAVVIPSFTEQQGTRLLNLTDNRYKQFRPKAPAETETVLTVLEKEGFRPIVHTSKKVDIVP